MLCICDMHFHVDMLMCLFFVTIAFIRKSLFLYSLINYLCLPPALVFDSLRLLPAPLGPSFVSSRRVFNSGTHTVSYCWLKISFCVVLFILSWLAMFMNFLFTERRPSKHQNLYSYIIFYIYYRVSPFTFVEFNLSWVLRKWMNQ